MHRSFHAVCVVLHLLHPDVIKTTTAAVIMNYEWLLLVTVRGKKKYTQYNEDMKTGEGRGMIR